jgi:hypothetical protein
MSEYMHVVDMRKSSVQMRSSFPSGAAQAAEILALHAVNGAEQVLEEVLVALAARAEQVGAPHEHVAREVRRMIGVFARHFQRAVPERLYHVLFRIRAGLARIPRDLERVRLQLRRARQPAHALGAHVEIDQAFTASFS